ncbi:hypothetical protein [Singulisphaera sp. PoT]|uniref:hypothetical protein n=1 Tax=Singulisphaera sp. PoT TaxID=3411797 RepID=UPI003BF5EBCB
MKTPETRRPMVSRKAGLLATAGILGGITMLIQPQPSRSHWPIWTPRAAPPGPFMPYAPMALPSTVDPEKPTDRCIITPPAIDERFVKAAPQMDERFVVAPKVVGLPFTPQAWDPQRRR